MTAGALFAQTAQHTENIYTDSLQGNWTNSSWGASVNLAASAPGRTGNSLEVTINGAWQAFRLSVSGDGRFLNEYASIDFDIYIHSDSTGLDNLVFVLEQGWAASQPKITDLISGWATMTTAQRYEQWHHIHINFADLNPSFFKFNNILLWTVGDAIPHVRLDNIQLGWNDDTTPPVVTVGAAYADYDHIFLPFTTNEYTVFQVDYGVGAYDHTITGGANAWDDTGAVVLAGLTRGSTVQYRITASDHRTDPNATPNKGVATGTIVVANPASVTGIVGQSASMQFTAAGGTSTYTYTLLGSLPTGLSLNAQTGLINGTST